MRTCAKCGKPQFNVGAACTRCLPTGLTRSPDHATSEKAAGAVTRKLNTIRAKVLHAFEEAPAGLIDHDLLALAPHAAESSFRKRRSELTDEGILVATNTTRENHNGQDSTVFVHRKFHPNPPPLKDPTPGKAAGAIRRSKREKLMHNALVDAAHHHAQGASKLERTIAGALGLEYPIQRHLIPAPYVL